MKVARWRQVKAVLAEVREAEEERRVSLLAERCAGDPELRREVEALLVADERAGEVLEPTTATFDAGALSKEEDVGPYRVIRRIGEGGMGEVYEAEQAKPVRRRVAMKLIKLGMDTRQVVARFDTERQALALMSHPSIARVFDAGTTEKGRPYFVMEYVPGVPVSDYCDTHHLGTRERLELFVQICEGVHHAHQKGIIHRDLKPSNVLVTEVDGQAVPKIIDFGVAKATAQRLTEATFYTELGQAIGTPEYMSPEQTEVTELDIDIRTDVYSLGVLLYELLTGSRPFDFRSRDLTFDEMRRRIRDEEPAKPSTRARQLGQTSPDVATNRRTDPGTLVSTLRGDLDWITMRALEKDRARRYGSVSELAADIQRHLDHRPVLAGPTRASYRMGKFVKRHRLGVGAAATVALALVLGMAAATVGLVRAQRSEAVARREAETAQQISAFLVELFTVSDPRRTKGSTVTVQEILSRGAERIEEELEDQPLVQARLMTTICGVYEGLGLQEEAASLCRSALRVREAALGPHDLTVAESLLNVCFTEINRGRYGEAEEFAKRSLTIRTDLLSDDDPRLAEGMSGLAQVYLRMGRLDEAQRLYERAVEINDENLPPDDPEATSTLNDLAVTYTLQRDYGPARELFRRLLATAEETSGPVSTGVGFRLTSLGIINRELGEYDEAQRCLSRAFEVLTEIFGERHPQVANTGYELGALYAAMGRHADAEPLLEHSLEVREALLGRDHPYVAETLRGLAELRRDQGRPREAEAHYRRGLSILENTVDPRHPLLAQTRESYAAFLRTQGREEEATAIEARRVETETSS